MADIGAEFTKFLIAYSMEDYNRIASDSVTDADVNSIISKHKSDFEAWCKIPEWMRDRYHGRVPREIIEKAKNDPNFTEFDAIKAEKEYRERGNPEVNAVKENEHTADMAVLGVTLMASQLAMVGIKSDEICKKGYSSETALKVAVNQEYIKAIHMAFKELGDYDKLSAEEKAKYDALDKQYFAIKEDSLGVLKEDLKETQPERALVRLLRDLNAGKTDNDSALPLIEEYLDKVYKMGRVEKLGEQLEAPMFKRLRDDTKEFLYDIIGSQDNVKDFERVYAKLASKMQNQNSDTISPNRLITLSQKGRNSYS